MYKLGFSNTAIKDLDKLEGRTYLRISDKINGLENNPRPTGSIKLTDIDAYRIRIGNYRVIYSVDDKSNNIVIYRILHRKEVYKKNYR
jgi:mRNA interferase RelE/StbE